MTLKQNTNNNHKSNMANNNQIQFTDNDYKIIPGVGFSKVKFGIKKEQLIELMGQPDEIEEDANYGDSLEDKVTVLYYDTDGFSVSFDKEANYRLTEISFESDLFILEDCVKVGMTTEEALKALEKAGYDEPSLEDLEGEIDPNDKTEAYTYDDMNITLWFDDNILQTIQMGPFWLDSDTIKWPK